MFDLNVESFIFNGANRAIHKVRSYCQCFGQCPPVTALSESVQLFSGTNTCMVVKFASH